MRIRQFCYNESFYIDIILDQNKTVEPIHNTLTVVFEKFKMVSLASSIMKDIFVFATRFRATFFLKLFVVLLLNQVLVVYLNLLLSFYSNY